MPDTTTTTTTAVRVAAVKRYVPAPTPGFQGSATYSARTVRPESVTYTRRHGVTR